MGKYAQLVMGPAGSGKTTYCKTILEHCQATGRAAHLVNFDPATEDSEAEFSIDIKELITLEDAMEEMGLGPNGGLVFCIEYLVENTDWLKDQISDFDSDYLIIDCPGQIELYTHHTGIKSITKELQNLGYNVCGVYLVDSQFLLDPSKYISGILMCLSAMVQLEVPYINVLSKCDLLQKMGKEGDTEDENFVEKCMYPDIIELLQEVQEGYSNESFVKLNNAIGDLIESFNMVSFVPLDITKEESIDFVLSNVDNAIQFGEDEEVKEPADPQEDIIENEINF